MDYQAVLDFWFTEIEPSLWFKKDADFDAKIASRFGELHQRASQGECYTWRNSAQGRLAEIIVLDQFSRNLFRDSAKAFATDSMSLAIAQEGVAQGHDKELSTKEKPFFYMPYMHSESKAIHEQAVKLFNQPGLEYNYDFELKHKAIIDRFGRYPHRNKLLVRESTNEELEFLSQPGSSF